MGRPTVMDKNGCCPYCKKPARKTCVPVRTYEALKYIVRMVAGQLDVMDPMRRLSMTQKHERLDTIIGILRARNMFGFRRVKRPKTKHDRKAWEDPLLEFNERKRLWERDSTSLAAKNRRVSKAIKSKPKLRPPPRRKNYGHRRVRRTLGRGSRPHRRKR